MNIESQNARPQRPRGHLAHAQHRAQEQQGHHQRNDKQRGSGTVAPPSDLAATAPAPAPLPATGRKP
ncbi:hypothetical protein A2U01_0006567 [Trifolium medium]|uniref:Uncharacterized protein n=1 Tax=Trifolium medium TaxID=97028 RepID=A0A392MG37_9FABA|nr:hypothetical protein [Trifolium medium]